MGPKTGEANWNVDLDSWHMNVFWVWLVLTKTWPNPILRWKGRRLDIERSSFLNLHSWSHPLREFWAYENMFIVWLNLVGWFFFLFLLLVNDFSRWWHGQANYKRKHSGINMKKSYSVKTRHWVSYPLLYLMIGENPSSMSCLGELIVDGFVVEDDGMPACRLQLLQSIHNKCNLIFHMPLSILSYWVVGRY